MDSKINATASNSDLKPTPEQSLAIDFDKPQNLLVSASAGSGKTRVLSERIIKRVREGKISFANLLVMTFTENAAFEMRSRIETTLKKYKLLATSDTEKALYEKLLSTLPLAQISTIHAFGNSILSNYLNYFVDRHNHDKVLLQPGYTVLTEEKSQELQNEAIEDIFRDLYSFCHSFHRIKLLQNNQEQDATTEIPETVKALLALLARFINQDTDSICPEGKVSFTLETFVESFEALQDAFSDGDKLQNSIFKALAHLRSLKDYQEFTRLKYTSWQKEIEAFPDARTCNELLRLIMFVSCRIASLQKEIIEAASAYKVNINKANKSIEKILDTVDALPASMLPEVLIALLPERIARKVVATLPENVGKNLLPLIKHQANLTHKSDESKESAPEDSDKSQDTCSASKEDIADIEWQTSLNTLFSHFKAQSTETENSLKALSSLRHGIRPVKGFEAEFNAIKALTYQLNIYFLLFCDGKMTDTLKEHATLVATEFKDAGLDFPVVINLLQRYDPANKIQLQKTLPLLQMFLALTLLFDEKYKALRYSQNLVEFSDYEHCCYELLQNPAIRNEVRSRFREIYVDEFQDTSNIQDAIINLLADDNLFLVGDIKQSIYLFRYANPKIFLNRMENATKLSPEAAGGKKEKSEVPLRENPPREEQLALENEISETKSASGGYYCTMNTNFRSVPPINDFVNRFFGCFMHKNEFDIDYNADHEVKSAPTLKTDDEACVSWLIGYSQKNTPATNVGSDDTDDLGDADPPMAKSGDDASPVAESSDDAQEDADLVLDSPPEIILKNASQEIEKIAMLIAAKILQLKSTDKDFNYDSTAILVNKNNDAAAIKKILRAMDLPLAGEALLHKNNIVSKQILQLLTTVQNPRQDIALCGFLLSPFVPRPLSLEDLLHLKLLKDKITENQRVLYPFILSFMSPANAAAPSETEKQVLALAGENLALVEKLRADLKKLLQYRTLASELDACDFLNFVIADNAYDEYLCNSENGDRHYAELTELMEFVRALKSSVPLSLSDLVQHITQNIENGSGIAEKTNRDALTEGESGIKVMTIHKSKGLQYKHVFIPLWDLKRKDNKDTEIFGIDEQAGIFAMTAAKVQASTNAENNTNTEDLEPESAAQPEPALDSALQGSATEAALQDAAAETEHQETAIESSLQDSAIYVPQTQVIVFNNALYAEHRARIKAALRAEEMRKFYVAVTRAESKIYFCSVHKNAADSDVLTYLQDTDTTKQIDSFSDMLKLLYHEELLKARPLNTAPGKQQLLLPQFTVDCSNIEKLQMELLETLQAQMANADDPVVQAANINCLGIDGSTSAASTAEHMNMQNSDASSAASTADHMNMQNSDASSAASTADHIDTQNSAPPAAASTAEHIDTQNSAAPPYLQELLKTPEKLADYVLNDVPDRDLAALPAKMSVSEIKRRYEEKSIWDTAESEDVKESTLWDHSSLTADMAMQLKRRTDTFSRASLGTLLHTVFRFLAIPQLLQKIPTLEDVLSEINRQQAQGIISKEETPLVLLYAPNILAFLQSDLASDIASADKSGKVYREMPFTLKVPAAEAGIATTRPVKILTQGIMDLWYFDRDGQIVIVDYKSDNFHRHAELWPQKEIQNHLRLHYQKQLDLYAMAFTNADQHKKVKRKVIWSIDANLAFAM